MTLRYNPPRMKQPVNVAQYGIGPIGAEIARLLLTKPWVRLVAAVDIDPKKIGRDVVEVIGLDRKVGAGMTTQEFRAAVDAGKIKHMGLRESLMLVGNGLGVEFDKVSEEKIEPIVAQREIVTQYLKVAPGQVAGVHQTIDGRGKINVSLELRMYVGAEDVAAEDRKSTRLNSSHVSISYAVFCMKKNKDRLRNKTTNNEIIN